MKSKYVHIPEPLNRPETFLDSIFNAFSRDPFPPASIKGENLFTGDVNVPNLTFVGDVSYTVGDQHSWEYLWSVVGHEPPGKLPRGANAEFLRVAQNGKEFDISLSKASMNDDQLSLDWQVDMRKAGEDTRCDRFAILIVPQTKGEVRQTIQRTGGQKPQSKPQI